MEELNILNRDRNVRNPSLKQNILPVWPCGEMHWHCECVRVISFQSEVLLLYFLSPTESVQFFQTSIRCEGKIKNCHEKNILTEMLFPLIRRAWKCKICHILLEKSGAIRHSKDKKPFCLVPQILLCDFKLTYWKKEWKKDAKCLSLNQNPLCTSMKGKEKLKSSQSAIAFFLHVAYFLKARWTEASSCEQRSLIENSSTFLLELLLKTNA